MRVHSLLLTLVLVGVVPVLVAVASHAQAMPFVFHGHPMSDAKVHEGQPAIPAIAPPTS